MSWASAVTNAAIVKNAKEKNPAVLYFIFNLLCGYVLITQLSCVFDGSIPHVNESKFRVTPISPISSPSFAFASSLEPDHVLLGFEANTKRLLEIVYLFRGRLLLGCALLLSLLLRLLAGSA